MLCHLEVQGTSRGPGPSNRGKYRGAFKGALGDILQIITQERKKKHIDINLDKEEEMPCDSEREVLYLGEGLEEVGQTCLKKVIGCCPIACASPMLALMTSANGFFTPCWEKAKTQMCLWANCDLIVDC